MRRSRKHQGVTGTEPLLGTINLATLMEFEAKTPGTTICSCRDFEPELNDAGRLWLGGEHLVSPGPGPSSGIRMHYYPDKVSHDLIILYIETVQSSANDV